MHERLPVCALAYSRGCAHRDLRACTRAEACVDAFVWLQHAPACLSRASVSMNVACAHKVMNAFVHTSARTAASARL
eukprot:3717867-Pleurochrysis_carterae.AAC.2